MQVKSGAGKKHISPHHHAAHTELGGDMLPGHRLPEERLDLPADGPVIPIDDADGDLFPPEFRRFQGLVPVRQRFLQPEDPLPIPGVGIDLVEADAGLEDVHQGRPLEEDRLPDQMTEVFLVAGETSGHKRGAHRDRESERIKGNVPGSLGAQGVFHAKIRRGGALPFGQGVDLVVGDHDGDVQTPADGLDEMVPSLAVHAAVAGIGDDGEIGTGQLDPHGERQGPAVEAVEIIHLQVMGHFGGLPDPRCENDLILRDGEFPEGLLQDVPDGEIAAAGAPGDIDSRFHISTPQDNRSFRDRQSSSTVKHSPLYFRIR